MTAAPLPLPEFCALLQPGECVYLSSATGEPTPLTAHWKGDPRRFPAMDLVTSFVPGVNPLVLDDLPNGSCVTGLFMHPGLQPAAATGRFHHLPLSYAGFVRQLRAGMEIDTLVVHVSPPDDRGFCSLGPTIEFASLVRGNARRMLAVVNPQVPALPGSLSWPLADFAAWCEAEAPLRTYAAGEPDALSSAIAREVARWIEDGTTLQIGIGKVPTALLHALTDRRRLRFHSGMISEGLVNLAEKGALGAGPHVACVMLGSPEFYDWLRHQDQVQVRGCEETHDAAILASLERFVAINSALEVDLLGQANLETIGTRIVSSVGGAPDFAHAASLNPDGLSIVALPSTGSRGKSRIVPALANGAPVSLSRQMIDVVVTEHGSADLRGKSAQERAEALIAVAAPETRADLLTYLNT